MNATRRAFMGGLASAVPATLATASTLAATTMEDPALLALGDDVSDAMQRFAEADARRVAARAAFDRLAPPVPEELVLKRRDASPLNWCCDSERDVEGRHVHQDNGQPRAIMSAYLLRTCGQNQTGARTRLGKDVRRRLAIAERYEAAVDVAVEQSDIDAAVVACDDAKRDAWRVTHAVYETRARTMRGLEIKAAAVVLYLCVHGKANRRGELPTGEAYAYGIAEDILRLQKRFDGETLPFKSAPRPGA